MKYCNNCGNKLEDGQRFCDKCGKGVGYSNINTKSPTPKNNGGKIAMIVITVLVFLLLVAGLIFGAYKLFWDNGNSNNNSGIQNKSSQNNGASDESYEGNEGGSDSGDTPSIDVLTDTFNTNFMNQDHRQNFGFARLGMRKDEIEEKFNNTGEKVTIDGTAAVKYGNIAINYVDGNVSRIFVAPDDVTIDEYIEFHGEPTESTKDGVTIYDDNKDNQYSIKVYSDGNGKVKGIENVEALDGNTDEVSNESEEESVNTEDEAKGKATYYLQDKYEADRSYDIGNVIEVDDGYRVNYFLSSPESRGALLVDKQTGEISEDD